MALHHNPRIVTDGLAVALDPADGNSYTSGSTDVLNLAGNISASFFNGTSYSNANQGVFDLDGSNDVIGMPYVQDTAGSFSVEVWAKCDSMDTNTSNRQTIFSFNTGTYGYQLLDLEVWFDGLTSFNGDGTNYTAPLNGSFNPVNANDWHCYTLSVNNGVQSWYKDGEFLTQLTPTYTATSAYFKLGSRGTGLSNPSQQWDGLMGPAKIYNRALTASEVLQNYNAAKTRFGL